MFFDCSLIVQAWRRTVGVIAVAASIACLLASPAQARCTGSNLVPNLKASHPAIMKKVRAAAAKIVNTEAILWRVEKTGVASSHLFGTMHVSDKRIMAMPVAAREAVENARLVALDGRDHWAWMGDSQPILDP